MWRVKILLGLGMSILLNTFGMGKKAPCSAAEAGIDPILCRSELLDYSLAATSPKDGEVGYWSSTNPLVEFKDSLAAATSVKTLLNSGEYELVWTISGENCISTSDTLSLTVLIPPKEPVLLLNSDINEAVELSEKIVEVCAETPFHIAGSEPNSSNLETISWTSSNDVLGWVREKDFVHSYELEFSKPERVKICQTVENKCATMESCGEINSVVNPALQWEDSVKKSYCVGDKVDLEVNAPQISSGVWRFSDSSVSREQINSKLVRLGPLTKECSVQFVAHHPACPEQFLDATILVDKTKELKLTDWVNQRACIGDTVHLQPLFTILDDVKVSFLSSLEPIFEGVTDVGYRIDYSGNYSVEVKVEAQNSCIKPRSISEKILISVPLVEEPRVIWDEETRCEGEEVHLKSSMGSLEQVWVEQSSGVVGQGNEIRVKKSGAYGVKSISAECESNISMWNEVEFVPVPYVNAGENQTVNVGERVVLNGKATGDEWLWSPKLGLLDPSSMSTEFYAKEKGVFSYKLTSVLGDCQASDAVSITVK